MKDGHLDFDEYIRQGEPAQRERAEAWSVAIGLQAVNGWCAPKGQQTDSKGQHPVAIGEDGEIGKMMNGMVGLTKHNMLLPLRGGFCESSQIPWTLPMAGRLSPFQGVNGWCAPKGQPSDNPMATPWATETPPSSSTSITATPVSATNEKRTIAPKGHKHQAYGTIAL